MYVLIRQCSQLFSNDGQEYLYRNYKFNLCLLKLYHHRAITEYQQSNIKVDNTGIRRPEQHKEWVDWILSWNVASSLEFKGHGQNCVNVVVAPLLLPEFQRIHLRLLHFLQPWWLAKN